MSDVALKTLRSLAGPLSIQSWKTQRLPSVSIVLCFHAICTMADEHQSSVEQKVGTTSAWWSFLHEVHSKHECVGHCHPRRIPNNGMGMKAHINKAVMPHPMDDLPSMDATLPIMMAAKMISMNLKLTTGWIASITKHGPFCNLG